MVVLRSGGGAPPEAHPRGIKLALTANVPQIDDAMSTRAHNPTPWQLCVAPMMDWTDRYCRQFHRLLAPHARLYTEMVTAAAVIHGDREHLLGFDADQHPLALQLGGCEPDALAQAARIAEEFGYDEINLNVGCPSDRVQSGRFGARLMLEPERVADCVAAMDDAVAVPVTVKCRLGVDDQCEERALEAFVQPLLQRSRIDVLVVHARKAWLKGLSPKENRTVPPLNHPRVYRLKRDYPQLSVIINGGIDDLAAVQGHLQHVDGVMLGRAAYQHPWLLAQLEHALYGTPLPRRDQILTRLRPWIEAQLASGTPLKYIARHLLGIYHGQPGGRRFRRCLSEGAHLPGAGWPLVQQALDTTRMPVDRGSAAVAQRGRASVTM